MLNLKDKLIIALDVDNLEKAKHFVDILYPQVKIFKVGSQLFTACGPDAVKLIHKKGAQVFLDLKFFDIPNTVANAVRQAVRLKIKMLTLHICGGEEMLKSAVKAARDESRRLKLSRPFLIGVSILTSQKADANQIIKLVRFGLKCGLDGVVCSAQETAWLRKKIRKGFIIITPGIRQNNSSCDDQKRTATATQAIKAGSSFLVVGRPILKATDPLRAAREIIRDCNK